MNALDNTSAKVSEAKTKGFFVLEKRFMGPPALVAVKWRLLYFAQIETIALAGGI
jgi:hypothetical protein